MRNWRVSTSRPVDVGGGKVVSILAFRLQERQRAAREEGEQGQEELREGLAQAVEETAHHCARGLHCNNISPLHLRDHTAVTCTSTRTHSHKLVLAVGTAPTQSHRTHRTLRVLRALPPPRLRRRRLGRHPGEAVPPSQASRAADPPVQGVIEALPLACQMKVKRHSLAALRPPLLLSLPLRLPHKRGASSQCRRLSSRMQHLPRSHHRLRSLKYPINR